MVLATGSPQSPKALAPPGKDEAEQKTSAGGWKGRFTALNKHMRRLSHCSVGLISIHSLTAPASTSSPMRSVHVLPCFTDEKLKHREAMPLTQSQSVRSGAGSKPRQRGFWDQLLKHDILLPL